MTVPVPDAAAVVDGVNLDAVTSAALACPSVAGLHEGSFGELASYFPGRRLTGVTASHSTVTVGVVARWGIPVGQLRTELTAACTPLLAGHRLDVVLGDIEVPATDAAPAVTFVAPPEAPAPDSSPPEPPAERVNV